MRPVRWCSSRGSPGVRELPHQPSTGAGVGPCDRTHSEPRALSSPYSCLTSSGQGNLRGPACVSTHSTRCSTSTVRVERLFQPVQLPYHKLVTKDESRKTGDVRQGYLRVVNAQKSCTCCGLQGSWSRSPV